ncbi:dihydrofolate reductase [Azospira inquinata]|uniref:Dihydrofolate reductase n=1 Tax=Azospira inquinata TaxID=2785627 RepID=A0A975SPA3_9RHOO|nr:dihydrofolate reductase [Azospira inquinata]QWT47434.1 dihydrofolate reductase [Azospira inquinata]QWT49943.1 dihydrofolate reductase [Azospira inquinata]
MTSAPATPPLALIAAVGANRAIGLNNRLLWSLPEDMAHFKALTQGRTVLMGRKTWESLPPRFRPLPGRRNIVISRNPDYQAPGAELAHSLEAALALAARPQGGQESAAASLAEVFVIGGAQLYGEALALADRLYLTEVADSPAADAFFPPVDGARWPETARETHRTDSGLIYAFVTRERAA